VPDENLDLIDPFDDCEWLPARELFRRLGFLPVPPAVVDDFQLRGRLWEFIHALAGRRFYLHDSNHLSDRELYTWLHDYWFPREVADIPFEAEWNCHVGVLDLENSNEHDEQIWLRFFANDKERDQWLMDNPGKTLPPRQPAAHDRDRWLPEPPGIPQDLDEDDSFPPDDEENEDDPLGLEKVDAEIRAGKDRAEKEREDALATTGGESAGWQRPIDELQRAGPTLLPPDELTDETLGAKLWELLHNLACRGFYVLHTDHLSDREVYTELWQRGLRDEALLPGKCRTGGWYHDFLGSWGEDDMRLWLRFYATDDERAKQTRDWPDLPLPPKEPRPFNRDWRLPKGPHR
jgi:hypothetical protein